MGCDKLYSVHIFLTGWLNRNLFSYNYGIRKSKIEVPTEFTSSQILIGF